MLRWFLIVAIVLMPWRAVMSAPPEPDAAATTVSAAAPHCHDDAAHASLNPASKPESKPSVCFCEQGCQGGDCGRGCCMAHAAPVIPAATEAVDPPPVATPTVADTTSHRLFFSARLLRPPIAVVA